MTTRIRSSIYSHRMREHCLSSVREKVYDRYVYCRCNRYSETGLNPSVNANVDGWINKQKEKWTHILCHKQVWQKHSEYSICLKLHLLAAIFNPGPSQPRYAQICPAFTNSVDPDQLASEEANWSWSALFVIKYVYLHQQSESHNLIGWKLEEGMASKFFSMARINMYNFISVKSAMRKPPQVIKSSTLPDSYGSGARVKTRKSSEEFRDSTERAGGNVLKSCKVLNFSYYIFQPLYILSFITL